MKKKIATLVLVTLSVLALAACGAEPFTCDMCGEEKTGKSYKSTTEEDMTVCEECYKMINDLFNDL